MIINAEFFLKANSAGRIRCLLTKRDKCCHCSPINGRRASGRGGLCSGEYVPSGILSAQH
nr:MAG TPA: hypothetical protein [Caudoviricetes sp.]